MLYCQLNTTILNSLFFSCFKRSVSRCCDFNDKNVFPMFGHHYHANYGNLMEQSDIVSYCNDEVAGAKIFNPVTQEALAVARMVASKQINLILMQIVHVLRVSTGTR